MKKASVMFNQYVDFEINISAAGDARYAVAVSGPGGDASGTLLLPTGDSDFQALIARLAALDTDEETLAQLGQLLFQALFQGAIKDVYTRGQGMLTSDQGLRLRLNIAPSETALMALPWEFLYDPDQGPLALLDAPIARYLPQSSRIPTLQTSLPLKVLLSGAQTPPQTNVERELNEVAAALSELGQHVQITVEPHLTAPKLQKLLRGGFHVWHFVGHGGFARDGATGQLLFEDATGDTEAVSALQLGILLNRSGVRLIVLDACNGAKLSTDPFRNTAPALIRAQIPAVVAMQFTVPEEATRAFATEFYRALAQGFPIDACVTEGRKAVMNATGLGRADWGIPVVYTRAHDGRLFELPTADEGRKTKDEGQLIAAATPAEIEPQPAIAQRDKTTSAASEPSEHTNLPAQSTALIGRDQDVATARDLLLRSDVRLVTLTGPAGVGKTRLAIEIAAKLLDNFPDGVLFVDLSVISDPELVLTEITQTLGIKEQGAQTLSEALDEYLRQRNLLLLLDNFEQVLPAAAQLIDLLEAAPKLQVIVTSRAALRVSGEYEFAVQPLALPDLKRLPPLPKLASFPAVALFVERARAVKPDFALTDANAARVAEICVRLDGLPLAIELAAARRKVLSTEALLARLTSRFDLLTGGARDLSARQQTLRGAIDWSYGLLSPNEQLLLARLAIFVGGCTVDAAEAVCAGVGSWGLGVDSAPRSPNSQPPTPVLDSMSSLVDNSLLQQVETGDGDARFVMLETIREYALERLVATGERAPLRQQHAVYYLRLAEQAEPELDRQQQDVWLERLEREHDNLLAALDAVWEQNAAELALRLCGALAIFWHTRGYLSEGRRWTDAALALASPADTAAEPALAALRAKALSGAGRLALTQGDYEQARAHYDAALALFQQLDDQRGVATALNGLAGLEGRLGNDALAQAHFDAALERFQQLGDKLNSARLLSNRGLIALIQGDQARAKTYIEGSLAIRREIGDTIGLIWSIANLGEIATRQGDTAQAIARYTRSLALSQKLGAKEGIAVCLEGLAQVAAARARPLPAARLWGAAEALREAIGAAHQQVWRDRYDRAVSAARAQAGPAPFDVVWAAGRDMPLEQAIAEAMETGSTPKP
jgi:predicted ATPase/Tfp pilus assembly protein PilF